MIENFFRLASCIFLCGLFASCDSATGIHNRQPLGVVLFIGDGMGAGALQAARLEIGQLEMERLPVHGSLRTASASHRITDSGAAATALATGVSTYNGAIGVGLDSVPLKTILEAAAEQGMATGLVTTSSVTHATPAAFVAHVANRYSELEIARQIANSDVSVVLGGGRQFFVPDQRPDGVDLLGLFREKGCRIISNSTILSGMIASEENCIVGLFAENNPPPADRRTPVLAEMAIAALSVLRRNAGGFVLLVEGAQIDWAAHQNDYEWLLAETIDLDASVSGVIRFLADRPNTLVIVTADHETGGLTVSATHGSDSVHVQWSTGGHTDMDVPLYASGANAGDLAGSHANQDVGKWLLRLIRSH